jgi:hypothetical protein
MVFTQAMKIYEYGKLGDLELLELISPALEELMKRHAST